MSEKESKPEPVLDIYQKQETDYSRKLLVLSGQISPRKGSGLGPGIAGSVNRGINKLNWLKLKQPVSKDPRCPKGTENGVFYANGEAYPDGPEITLIHIHFVRRYTEEVVREKGKREFVSQCSSIDGVHGRSWKNIHQNTDVAECDGCRFTVKEPTGKGYDKSKCSLKYAFVGIIGDLEGIVQFEIGGTSFLAAKNLVDQAVSDPEGIWAKRYTLGSVEEGAYHTWDVTASQKNPEEIQVIAEKLNELYTEKYEEARTKVSNLMIRDVTSGPSVTTKDLEGSDNDPIPF